MNKVVLVTGATGLLGKAVRRYIRGLDERKNMSFHFIGSEIDLRNKEACQRYISSLRPTHVIHLAAKVGGLFTNMNNNVDFYLDNININNNVLLACHQTETVERVVSCLSTCIFPDGLEELNEENVHEGEPHPSNQGYAFSKRMLLVLSDMLNQDVGKIKFSCITPCNMYGTHDHFNETKSHVIPALISQFYDACTSDQKQLVLHGTGHALRQFIHVDDVAPVLWCELWHDSPVLNMIVADESEYAIMDVGTILTEIFGIEHTFDNDVHKDGQGRKKASIKLLKERYPDFTCRDLETGLTQVCQWYTSY